MEGQVADGAGLVVLLEQSLGPQVRDRCVMLVEGRDEDVLGVGAGRRRPAPRASGRRRRCESRTSPPRPGPRAGRACPPGARIRSPRADPRSFAQVRSRPPCRGAPAAESRRPRRWSAVQGRRALIRHPEIRACPGSIALAARARAGRRDEIRRAQLACAHWKIRGPEIRAFSCSRRVSGASGQLEDLILGDLPRIDGGRIGLKPRDHTVANQVELAGGLGRKPRRRHRPGTR